MFQARVYIQHSYLKINLNLFKVFTGWGVWIMDPNSLQLLRFIDFADVDDTHGLEYRTLGLLNLPNSIPVAAQGEQIMALTAIINFKKKIVTETWF